VIAAERARANRRTLTSWHHGSPGRGVLDAPDPPVRFGRYHRPGGHATWYGSSTQAGAWAEFVRSLPDGADATEFPRRIGRVDFNVLVLDLGNPALQDSLGVRPADLTGDDLSVCQTLADIAFSAGFEAVLGPSAAKASDTTLAVFDGAIKGASRNLRDLGEQTYGEPTGPG